MVGRPLVLLACLLLLGLWAHQHPAYGPESGFGPATQQVNPTGFPSSRGPGPPRNLNPEHRAAETERGGTQSDPCTMQSMQRCPARPSNTVNTMIAVGTSKAGWQSISLPQYVCQALTPEPVVLSASDLETVEAALAEGREIPGPRVKPDTYPSRNLEQLANLKQLGYNHYTATGKPSTGADSRSLTPRTVMVSGIAKNSCSFEDYAGASKLAPDTKHIVVSRGQQQREGSEQPPPLGSLPPSGPGHSAQVQAAVHAGESRGARR